MLEEEDLASRRIHRRRRIAEARRRLQLQREGKPWEPRPYPGEEYTPPEPEPEPEGQALRELVLVLEAPPEWTLLAAELSAAAAFAKLAQECLDRATEILLDIPNPSGSPVGVVDGALKPGETLPAENNPLAAGAD